MDPDELCGYDILIMDIDMGSSFDLSGSACEMDIVKQKTIGSQSGTYGKANGNNWRTLAIIIHQVPC